VTETILLGSAMYIAVLIAVNFYRVAVGPTIFDRLIAVGLVGNNAVLLIVLMGFLYGRMDMFLDLAITYAILNFVGVVALGKYLESAGSEGK